MERFFAIRLRNPNGIQQMNTHPNRTTDWHHYLPAPDPTTRSFFYLTSAGRCTVQPHDPYPKEPHPRLYHFSWSEGRVLPEFLLLLVTQGRGFFESERGSRMRVSAGQVLMLPPNRWHRYRPDPEVGWTEKWLHFDGAIAHQLFAEEWMQSVGPVVTLRNFRSMEVRLDRLMQTIQENLDASSSFFAVEALGVVAAVMREASKSSRAARLDKKAADSVVAAAIDYIWTRGRNVLGVPEVADALGLSRRTLERHMLTVRGHSVLDEIIDCRFSRAERLLRSTNLPLKVIVSLSGFGSLENMRQVFVAKTRLSPSGYRQLHGRVPVRS